MDSHAMLKGRIFTLATLGNGQAIRDIFRNTARPERAIVAYALQDGIEKQVKIGHAETFTSLYPDIKSDRILRQCAFEGLANATNTLLQGPVAAFARVATTMIAHQRDTHVCAQWHERIKPALDTRIHLATSNDDVEKLNALSKHLGFLKD